MLMMHIIHGLTNLVQGYISASLSQRIVSRVRKELFDKIVHLPIAYIDSHSHGDLISRMTNDAENVSSIISSLLGLNNINNSALLAAAQTPQTKTATTTTPAVTTQTTGVSETLSALTGILGLLK